MQVVNQYIEEILRDIYLTLRKLPQGETVILVLDKQTTPTRKAMYSMSCSPDSSLVLGKVEDTEDLVELLKEF